MSCIICNRYNFRMPDILFAIFLERYNVLQMCNFVFSCLWIIKCFIQSAKINMNDNNNKVNRVFHNSRLITRIHQKIFIILQFTDLTRGWMQITCLAVSHSNYYTRMFSVLVGGCNWILFMHGWFCPICLIHLIGRKSLHFEKKLDCFQQCD